MKKCECCGEPRTFHFHTTLGGGERITVDTTGFETRLDAVNAALKALRGHKATVANAPPLPVIAPAINLARVDIADLVGAGEIAKRLATTKNVIVNWAGRYEDFPEPVIDHLAMGRIWSWREVEAWHARWSNPE